VVLLSFGYGIFEVLAVEVPWVMITLNGIVMVLSGLAGGVLSLIALLRRHERSVLVWLALVPGLASVVFLIGEFSGRW
jgi:hypothetical protein